MTTGILKHTLRGINGWSFLSIKYIDVMKVVYICHHQRLFCIFNQEHPWTLTIEYDEPVESWMPVYTTGGYGITRSVDLTQFITRRYRTERDVLTEISQIEQKQAAVIQWQNEISESIMGRISKSASIKKRRNSRNYTLPKFK